MVQLPVLLGKVMKVPTFKLLLRDFVMHLREQRIRYLTVLTCEGCRFDFHRTKYFLSHIHSQFLLVFHPFYVLQFGTDLPKAENLVSIAQYFDLEEYTQRRLGQVRFTDIKHLLNLYILGSTYLQMNWQVTACFLNSCIINK